MKIHFTKIVVVLMLVLISSSSFGQSKTTEALSKKYTDAMAFFFYNNTLRMLNQKDDKGFDELIKDIEKMKLLMIKKAKDFNYKKITSDYKAEAFEEIITSRYQGKNFDVYLKESDGKTKGMIVLVNDSASLYVLDIVGRIALDKVTQIYKTIDESSDITNKIKAFSNDGHDDNKDHHKSHE